MFYTIAAWDTLEAIAPVVSACRSNFSGGGLETACGLLGDVQCQSQPVLAHILESCARNIDGSCGAYGCGYY
jgi:hypothetical protein